MGDVAEVKAVKQVFSDWSHIKMNGTKSMIGHCLGAAGGLEAVATIQAIRTGWVHPTINQVRDSFAAVPISANRSNRTGGHRHHPGYSHQLGAPHHQPGASRYCCSPLLSCCAPPWPTGQVTAQLGADKSNNTAGCDPTCQQAAIAASCKSKVPRTAQHCTSSREPEADAD